jgi:hypothetical protein
VFSLSHQQAGYIGMLVIIKQPWMMIIRILQLQNLADLQYYYHYEPQAQALDLLSFSVVDTVCQE